jgi:hypothetical protein
METSKYPAIKKFKSSKTRENGIKVAGEAGGVNIFNHLEHAGFRNKKILLPNSRKFFLLKNLTNFPTPDLPLLLIQLLQPNLPYIHGKSRH